MRFAHPYNAREVEVVNRLYWDKEWRMLHMELPLSAKDAEVFAECAYGTAHHLEADGEERSMHRFLDIAQKGQAGLCIANDSKYTYVLNGNVLRIPLARSAIFAQGSGKNWYNPLEGYEYSDIGRQEFRFLLSPHGKAIGQRVRYRLAKQVSKPYLSLLDNIHNGRIQRKEYCAFYVEGDGIQPVWAKTAEDGDGIIIRLLETEGRDQEGILHIFGNAYPFCIGHHAIETIKIEEETKNAKSVNLLEK